MRYELGCFRDADIGGLEIELSFVGVLGASKMRSGCRLAISDKYLSGYDLNANLFQFNIFLFTIFPLAQKDHQVHAPTSQQLQSYADIALTMTTFWIGPDV